MDVTRSRSSDEQTIKVLKEQEPGMATADLGPRHRISQATFCMRKARPRGLIGKHPIRTPVADRP